MMKILIHTFALLLSLTIISSCGDNSTNDTSTESQTNPVIAKSEFTKKDEITELKLQTLMKETLALADNIEVIMSKVEVPKNTTLPMHFHPGEEFAYILEGSGTINLKGEEKMVISAGESGMVPFKHHHSFTSMEEGAKILVFRIHEKGQPERVLIKDSDEHSH